MDQAKLFLSSFDAGGGDPGDPIGQSLRFRDGNNTQFLESNTSFASSSTKVTVSYWIKIANVNQTNIMPIVNYGGGVLLSNSFDARSGFTPNPQNQNHFFYGSAHTPEVYQDPSAWYHIVQTTGLRDDAPVNTTSNNVWINGVDISGNDKTTNAVVGQSDTFKIGRNTGHPGSFQGCIANFYFIDDQALQPTAFGRYNANGVWVPRDIDFNGNWGTNGFYLDFADPDNLGLDRSGNGNDFTATGFDTAPVGIFSDDLFTYQASQAIVDNGPSEANLASTDKVFAAGSPATYGFNGNAGNYTMSNNTGMAWVWRPSTPIENVTQIDIRGLTGQPVYINGTVSATRLNDAQQTVYNGAAITLETLSGLPATAGDVWQSGGSAGFGAIWINGTMFVDNTGTDYDVMQDSPTQNYASLNPIVSGTSNGTLGLTDANLGFKLASNSTLGYYRPSFGTVPIPSTGKWYWEITVGQTAPEDPNNGQPKMGITAYPFVQESANDLLGQSAMMGADGYAFRFGSSSYDPYGPTQGANAIPVGNVLGFAFDADTGEFRAYNNGVDLGLMDTVPADTQLYTVMSGVYAGSGPTPINFGQRPFNYTPPEEFEALQTLNLPEPPIANGRDHFQALTGPGSPGVTLFEENTATGVTGPLALTSGGTTIPFAGNFTGAVLDFLAPSPSLSVTYAAPTNCDHVVLSEDGVNWTDTGSQSLTGTITYNAADNGGNNIRYIRYHTSPSTAFSWGAVNGNVGILDLAQQTFPNGLWWIKDRANSDDHLLVDSVNGTSAVINSPTGSVTAYAAPAGNSVAWCWNADNTDGGFSITNGTHGLGTTPAFVIDRALNVWHQSLPVGQGLTLTSGAVPSSQTWTVNDTTVSGPGGGTYYAWAEIPGYSSFGIWEGSSPSQTAVWDGTFLNLNFKPAFILVKGIGVGESWVIKDTARNPFNPAEASLLHSPAAENNNNPIDFLSNGIKMRNGDGQWDALPNGPYVYACFAENPFSSPVTAR